MKIELINPTIREVASGYVDNQLEGVYALDGKLNVRPKYQREFIYAVKERNAVIETIRKGFPLNVMYWCRNTDTDTYEVLDGQQRTISFCQYVSGDFSLELDGLSKSFHNLTASEQNEILDYKLMVYVCEGNDKEKLDWFRIINIAGKPLNGQELRNAVYTGAWLSDAKLKFSKPNCPAYNLGKQYVSGDVLRQDYLETALSWLGQGDVDGYMSVHQHEPNANELWMYFRSVIEWVSLTFPKYRKEMKGIDWGSLYDKFHSSVLDVDALEQEVKELMLDDDVTNKKGVYPYVLTREEKWLNIRAFTENQKREAYERQGGICKVCGKHFDISEMEGDHILAWSKGGHTDANNCQMLCRECNRRKSNRG